MNKQFSLEEVIIIVSFVIAGMIIFGAEKAGADVKPNHIVKRTGDIWVMVIDTGISPHKMLTDYVQYDSTENYVDEWGHGTHVTGIVAYGNNKLNDPLCKNVKIFSCQYYNKALNDEEKNRKLQECVTQATTRGMDYINISANGIGANFDEYTALSKFPGTIVNSAGNDGQNLAITQYYPSNYGLNKTFGLPALNNILVVMNEEKPGKLNPNSNYHTKAHRRVGTNILSTWKNNRYKYLSGTSMAAPALLHDILKKRCEELK